MPFSHPLITSQDHGLLAALQNSCSKSQNVPHPIMWSQKKSKHICQAQTRRGTCGVHLHCALHLFIRTFTNIYGMPGMGMSLHYTRPPRCANRTHLSACCGATHSPASGFFNLLRDNYIFISRGEKGTLGTALRRVIKTMWLSKYFDKNVNMYSTAILKERF